MFFTGKIIYQNIGFTWFYWMESLILLSSISYMKSYSTDSEVEVDLIVNAELSPWWQFVLLSYVWKENISASIPSTCSNVSLRKRFVQNCQLDIDMSWNTLQNIAALSLSIFDEPNDQSSFWSLVLLIRISPQQREADRQGNRPYLGRLNLNIIPSKSPSFSLSSNLLGFFFSLFVVFSSLPNVKHVSVWEENSFSSSN